MKAQNEIKAEPYLKYIWKQKQIGYDSLKMEWKTKNNIKSTTWSVELKSIW